MLIHGVVIVNTQVTLISIYTPNEDDPSFYQNLFYTISTYSGQYVIGGDFNCVLDIQLDRSTGIDSTHQKSRRKIKRNVKDLNLTEIWIHLNPNKREYSCFSNTHKTYSRIDYFIVSSNLLSKIERCWYDSILLSDHAPISLTMQFSNLKPTPFRFQTSLLQSSKFVDFMDKRIEEYFSINTDQTSASTKWEAFKAYIRGEIMSYTSRKSKEYYTKLGDLDQQIKELEIELIENNDPENKKKVFIKSTIQRADY